MNIDFVHILEVVETAVLVAALFFMTGVIREKKHTPAHKALQKKAAVCIAVYLAMNIIRNYFF